MTAPAPTSTRGTAARWSLVVAVLLVAGAVALWPRTSAESPDRTGPTRTGPDLAALRDGAALEPCPTAPAGAMDSGVLAGITVTCLGTGAPVAIGAALTGEDTLLNVWSHTCEPCRDELPALQEYALRPDAVRVVGVQVDGSEEAGLALSTALGVTLPAVRDRDNAVRAALSAPPVLPLSYFVTSSGVVWMVNPPVVFRSADQVAAVVEQYRGGA